MEFFRQKGFIQRFNAGDRGAFLSAYDHFAPKLLKYGYFKTGANKDLAEELVQSVFYKTWEYLASDKRQAIKNIQAFLYRVARNAVIDHWRRGVKEPLPLMDELAEVSDNSAWRDSAELAFQMEELVEVMRNIPPQYREVIELRYLEQLEIAEICAVLEKSSNSVYVLLHRALRAMKLKLDAREFDSAGRQKLGMLIASADD